MVITAIAGLSHDVGDECLHPANDRVRSFPAGTLEIPHGPCSETAGRLP